ncbi:uncharacterized protein LOC118110240 isoform X2 [Hippoglossus stenolepis]|nr:uncharacterized protein LOC118110240 isoform X2 [Hippoglossus stenolepis]
MIQLRASNAAIFTGRKNSAMRGWRAIGREMGLQGLMSARQLKKKWNNLKEKYKVLKNPPVGMENSTTPSSWRWFHLMDQAMSGGLAGTANVVQPSLLDEDEAHAADLPPLSPHSMEEDFSAFSAIEAGSLKGVGVLGGILEATRAEPPAEGAAAGGDGFNVRIAQSQSVINGSTLPPDRTTAAAPNTNKTSSSAGNMVQDAMELDRKLSELQRERRALEREQAEFDRELIALERDRALLNRDMAALQRELTAVERERAAVDKDRAFLDRDRAFLDRDRAFLERDRAVLDRDRAFVERAQDELARERALFRREREAVRGSAEMTTEEVVLQTRFYQNLRPADLDPDQLETRQRLVSLFQKLVEKL